MALILVKESERARERERDRDVRETRECERLSQQPNAAIADSQKRREAYCACPLVLLVLHL